MQRIEYHNVIDKKDWPPGPWHDEPDKVQWLDEVSGLPCLIVRGSSGANCGYVGVPEGHPLHGKDYNDAYEADSPIDVHGGLTFAGSCTKATKENWQGLPARILAKEKEARQYPIGDAARYIRTWGPVVDDYAGYLKYCESRFICHLTEPGDPENIWWFGFDCAHSGDLCPAYQKLIGRRPEIPGDIYKSFTYVEREVQLLASQLKKVEQNANSEGGSR